jgi:hypothetical protein
VPKDHKVLKVLQVVTDLKVIKDQLQMMDLRDLKVKKVISELRVQKDFVEDKVIKDL